MPSSAHGPYAKKAVDVTNLKEIHIREIRKYKKLMAFFTAFVALTVLLSVSRGDASISVFETAKIIIGELFSADSLLASCDPQNASIVWDVRLPRILTGMIVGAGLAVSGSIFQSILRNPLADPYTIGVSTGAAFGAVLAIYVNIIIGASILPVMPAAFIFALLTLTVITKIAGHNQTLNSSQLVLAGIIVSAILSSGISLIKSMAGEDVGAIVFWIMGSLFAKSWSQFLIALPIISICCIIAHSFADDLDILTLGVSEAKNVGVNAGKRMRMYLVIASLMTAVCVSVSGVIGFVGLVVPHILRIGVSAKHRYLIPLSAVLGGTLLCLADNISRLMFAVEIPVGVITTLIGGPFFIYLFMDKKAKGGII